MADDGDKEFKDSRFSYLLQPIRDLAANWDINIAGELVEYLEELENITFTIEGLGPALNFAEAALLIQGTTCVFSKKVEYLHNLVYQALETIFNKKQKEKQAAASKDKAGRRAAAVDDGLDDAEAFFNLSSQLEIAADSEINLDDDDETVPPELVRPPTALLALEDAASGQGQQGNPGEVGSYRLAQCSVHLSGALLLESKDGELFDAHLRMVRRGAAGVGSQGMMGDILAGLRAGSQPAAAAGASLGEEQSGHMVPADYGHDDEAGHDGYCDDGDVFMAAEELAMPEPEAEAAAGCSDLEATAADDQAAAGLDHVMADLQHESRANDDAAPDWLSQPAGAPDGIPDVELLTDTAAAAAAGGGATATAAEDVSGPVGRIRQQRTNSKQAAANAAGQGSFYDPYVPLDPADPGPLPIKPLQVRKPKRRTNLSASQSTAICSVAGLNSSHHPQLHWPEFGYLMDKIAAAAAAARRKGKSQQQQQQQQQSELPPGLHQMGPEVAPVLDWQDAAAAEQREHEAALVDDDDCAGYVGGDGYEDDPSPGNELLGDIDALDAAGQEAAGALRPWATGAVGMPDWMGGNAVAADGEMTYEELCRSHIESLIAAAAAQQVQSELAVRVNGWRARIDPILAAEEDRSAFDIHDYGTKILDKLVEVSDTSEAQREQRHTQQQPAVAAAGAAADVMDFKQVAAAADSFEVCRLFAAVLQLVNNRNVNLVKDVHHEDDGSTADAGQTCNKLQLQLLTVARVHEAMAEGLAGGAGDAGLQACDRQLEAPPPRKKPAAGKKAKKAAKAAASGSANDDDHAAAPADRKKKQSGSVSRIRRNNTAGDNSSSDEGDTDVSDLTDSETDEVQHATAAAARVQANKNTRKATGSKGQRKGGKSAPADFAGDDSSDGGFDADAENHQGGVAAAAAPGKGSKCGKPPAKRSKRAAAAPIAA